MRRIRSNDTGPELLVRAVVSKLGFRYRLHRKDLPGSPDLVFGPRKKVIFVHGCFWHQHGCKNTRLPKTNSDYWLPKLKRNQERDKKAIATLQTLGWDVLVIWECETKKEELGARIAAFLER